MNTWYFPHCPTSPEWKIEWTKLEAKFDWLSNLANCLQNPIYHAEGDVLIHTRLVCEALVSLPTWRQLPETERNILFAAALLHDVAKPEATNIEEDGKITAKGHVRLGSKMAREILWELEVPFYEREAIVSLIEYGSLPLWFWDKISPQRSIIRASQIVRCDWIALLAEADVKGRECDDQKQLLESIEFFREFCQENECFNQPRQFASPHSRFVYFHKENADPNYAAYDDTKFEVTLMSGLPAAGKDTWIEENAGNLPIISLDELRQKMNISPEENQGEVVQAAKNKAKEYMKTGTSFVWNATNISSMIRSSLIRLFAAYQARVKIIYLEAPLPELLRRNNTRKAKVPEKVIERLAYRLEIPNLTEAHSVNWLVDY